MPELAIVGAGGHGAVVAEAAESQRAWSAIGFYDDHHADTKSVLGHPLHGPVAALYERLLQPAPPQVVVAIGDNALRVSLSKELASRGALLATVVHPSCVLSPSARVGPGSVVLAGAVINARSDVGRACIVNTRASIDHDCTIADGAHIAPGAALAGDVLVGEQAWVGIGASIIQGVTIGRGSIVGAGAAVISDVPDGQVAVGCPARVRKP